MCEQDVVDRLMAARRRLGMTQAQVAHALGVDSITVSRWERGVSRPSRLARPRIDRFLRRHREDA